MNLRAIAWTVSAVLSSSIALAQQQPGITIPLPNVPGVTTPTPQQRQPYYPPQQDQRYPDQRYQDQQRPPGYNRDAERERRCQDLSYQERDIQNQLASAPRSGRQHDELVYQLGQIHNQQDRRCR